MRFADPGAEEQAGGEDREGEERRGPPLPARRLVRGLAPRDFRQPLADLGRQIKVVPVELRLPEQPRQVHDLDPAVQEQADLFLAQFAQHAVGMDRGHAAGLGQIGLADGQGAAVQPAKAARILPDQGFGKQAGDPRPARQPSVAKGPVAFDGGVQQRDLPQLVVKVGRILPQVRDGRMRQGADPGRSQGHDLVVAVAQPPGRQVDEVARDQQPQQLPPPLVVGAIAAREPFKQIRAGGHGHPGLHQLVPGPDRRGSPLQGCDQIRLGACEQLRVGAMKVESLQSPLLPGSVSWWRHASGKR